MSEVYDLTWYACYCLKASFRKAVKHTTVSFRNSAISVAKTPLR